MNRSPFIEESSYEMGEEAKGYYSGSSKEEDSMMSRAAQQYPKSLQTCSSQIKQVPLKSSPVQM